VKEMTLMMTLLVAVMPSQCQVNPKVASLHRIGDDCCEDNQPTIMEMTEDSYADHFPIEKSAWLDLMIVGLGIQISARPACTHLLFSVLFWHSRHLPPIAMKLAL
jgi:hypothetical protein